MPPRVPVEMRHLVASATGNPVTSSTTGGYRVSIVPRPPERRLRSLSRRLELGLPDRASSPLVLSSDAVRVTVTREGATEVAGNLADGAVAYRDAWPGIDATVFARAGGIEELLVARGEGEARYRIELPRGFRLVRPVEKLAFVEVVDPSGIARLRFTALSAWDADARRVGVEMELRKNTIAIRIPGAAREPVTVDPEWQTTADMAIDRSGHTATLLPDGKVLVCGGDALGTGLAELYDPATETFTAAGSLLTPRASGHTATLLADGRVLIAGGSTASERPPQDIATACTTDGGAACDNARGRLADAELYHPLSQQFTPAASLGKARAFHAATLLPDGTVLLTGGVPFDASSNGEFFDPPSATFYAAGYDLKAPVAGHLSTLLPSGAVLLAGSQASGVHAASQLYTPSSGEFTLLQGSVEGPALPLPSGEVAFSKAVYDPASGAFMPGSSCSSDPREGVLLPSGNILWRGTTDTAFFDASDHACSTESADADDGGTLTLLPTGSVLHIRGGSSQAELFAPDDAETRVTAGALNVPRQQQAATLLPSGKVLFVGDTVESHQAETYDPLSHRFELLPHRSDVVAPPTLVTLQSGIVAVGNAFGATGPVASYEPATGLFSPLDAQGAVLPFAGDAFLTLGSGLVGTYDYAARAAGLSAPLDAAATTGIERGPRDVILANDTSLVLVRGDGATSSIGTATLSLQRPLPQATLTALPSTDVLIVGGGHASLFTKDDVEVPLGDPGRARRGHTATLLPTGKVLIAGGTNDSSTELFDPSTTHFHAAAPMLAARSGHTATLLQTGQVLVASGTTAELYDATKDGWSDVSNLTPSQNGQTATLLPDGTVLFAGGNDAEGKPLDRTEIYDPDRDTERAGPTLKAPRSHHTATVLPSGDVLLAGGDSKGTAELFTVADGGTSVAGTMQSVRNDHSATLLPSGEVVVLGGFDRKGGRLDSAEFFDPTTAAWSRAPSLRVPRAEHAAVLLPTGRVLLAGGGEPGSQSALDVYDASASTGPTEESIPGAPPMGGATVGALLPDGNVLVSGESISFIVDPTSSKIKKLKVESPGSFGAVRLGTGPLILCGATECGRHTSQNDEPLLIPHASSGPSTLTALPDGSMLLRGRNAIGGGYTLRYSLLPARAVRPSITSPGTVRPGQLVVLKGQRLTSPSAPGSEAAPSRPEIFPTLSFVPAGSTLPIFIGIESWKADSITWRVPSTPFHGPGWLYAVVQGVPSKGVFLVIEPSAIANPCDTDAECQSGHCSEGICCDQACTSGCQSCHDVFNHRTEGQCSPMPLGAAPRSGCESDPDNVCSATGVCDGAGQCALPPSTRECHTARTPSGVCIGGDCELPPPPACAPDRLSVVSAGAVLQKCGAYRCEEDGGAACLSSCSKDDDCTPGLKCTSEGACRACSADSTGVDLGGSSVDDCGDYFCRDGECLTACESDADCRPWSTCRGGACSPACDGTNEGVKRRGSSGVESTSCGSYRCRDGSCLSSCNSQADCASGSRCNPSRRCEPDTATSAVVPSDPSCACSTLAERPTTPRAFGASASILAFLSFVARRRRAVRGGATT